MRGVFGLVLVLVACLTQAQTIGPLSRPPALEVKTWYHGAPVEGFEKGKTYVIDFCSASTPSGYLTISHLDDLASINPEITFISVDVWEDEVGTNVKDFLNRGATVPNYHLGYGGNKTGMSKTWLEAAIQTKLPTAFIVSKGVIQWIGPTTELDNTLIEIKAGTFDSTKAWEKFFGVTMAQWEQSDKDMGTAEALVKQAKYSEALTLLDRMEKVSPRFKGRGDFIRLKAWAVTDFAKWEAKVKEMVASRDEGKIGQLILGTYVEATSHKATKTSSRTIEIVLAGASESDALTFYGISNYYMLLDQYKLALEQMDRAIAALPKSPYKDVKTLKESMDKARAYLLKHLSSGG